MRGCAYCVLILIVLLGALALYALYDNNRVVVVRETVVIDGLPASFDGFAILQITDLHSKRFGPAQRRLLEVIAGVEHDLVAVTGDVIDSSGDFEPFWELLAGLDPQIPILFVRGNWDPWGYDYYTGQFEPFGEELIARGVHLLNEPYPVRQGEDTLWLTENELLYPLDDLRVRAAAGASGEWADAEYWMRVAERLDLLGRFWDATGPAEIKIALAHYPLTESTLARTDGTRRPDSSLILAGHYHGGQIRLPFVGAIYVPAETGGFFPSQHLVSGLANVGPYQQYVSRGLGAADYLPFLSFRLFNPPEINLIVLRRPA